MRGREREKEREREREREQERGELVTVATRRVTLRQWHIHREGESEG